MFNDVIVGVGDYEAGRDAVALARELAAGGRPLTLAYIEVVGPKLVPRSEAAWPEADCRRARKWLALLGDELRVEAEPVCVESHSVGEGLRTLAATEAADLLVIGASRRDEYERLLDRRRHARGARQSGLRCCRRARRLCESAIAFEEDRIGYDGSPASERALAVGRRLARDLG
jgi:nucleotide-binding universal stress UspA family protein